MKRKMNLIALGMVTVITLSACQKSPESSIVKNKDLDNMIEEAGNTENGSGNVAELAENYDTYQTTITDDSLKVTVNVDAKVDIPKADQMSVARIRQKNLTQDLLDKVKEELIKGETLYDGSALNMKTRETIEQEIQSWERELSESDDAAYKDEIQREIDELQEAYESAPTEIAWESYPSDGKIHSVSELYEKDKQNSYYAWQQELNPNGEVFYGVSDGKNGNYLSLYVQNNENYGNCLRFGRDKHGYINMTSVVADDEGNFGKWKIEDGFSEDDLIIESAGSDDLVEYTDSPVTITQEAAQAQAQELLEKLGLTDFQFYEGGLYGEAVNEGYEGKIGYRKVYILKYLRSMNGVFVNNDGGDKYTDGWVGEEYVKKMWSGENVEVLVNDDGIVGFHYRSPIEITETVVEQASMKSFDEIKDIFEQMVVVTNATGSDEEDKLSIDIDRVILRYTRISEEDSFDTGLLVPVWDFMGRITGQYGEKLNQKSDTCILTINAIDGTVIDRALGY